MTNLKCTAEGLVPISDEDQAFLDAVKTQDEAWAAGANDEACRRGARKTQRALLAETDYFGASDVTMSDAWRHTVRRLGMFPSRRTSLRQSTGPQNHRC